MALLFTSGCGGEIEDATNSVDTSQSPKPVDVTKIASNSIDPDKACLLKHTGAAKSVLETCYERLTHSEKNVKDFRAWCQSERRLLSSLENVASDVQYHQSCPTNYVGGCVYSHLKQKPAEISVYYYNKNNVPAATLKMKKKTCIDVVPPTMMPGKWIEP
ncbi:MAG: hypothetical protein HKM24_07640 [Gammaproteobacteria bacterium]|nr:hypothetical protein [Gammaproteobacteria bacterium]